MADQTVGAILVHKSRQSLSGLGIINISFLVANWIFSGMAEWRRQTRPRTATPTYLKPSPISIQIAQFTVPFSHNPNLHVHIPSCEQHRQDRW